MKAIVNFIAVVLVIAIMALVIVGGYYGVKYLWNLYAMLTLEMRVGLLTISVSLILSSLILVGGLRIAARQISNGRLAELRHDLYVQVLILINDITMASDASENSKAQSLLGELSRLRAEMFLLAGSDVVATYLSIEKSLQSEKYDPDEIEVLLNKLVSSFRGDLGHSKTYSESKTMYLSGKPDANSNSKDDKNLSMLST